MTIKIKKLLPYFLASLFSIVAMTFYHELWNISINIPLAYSGDGLFFLNFVRVVLEGDIFLRCEMTGAPFRADFFDFPVMASFDVLLIRIIGLFSSNPATVTNLFYFLTYPLTAVITVFVAKKMWLRDSIAVLIAVLFAILPYHFFRNVGHLNLSGYYFVPFAALIVYMAYFKYADFYKDDSRKLNFKSYSFVLCVIMSVCIGLSSLYYSFFTLIVMGFAVIITYGVERDIKTPKLLMVFFSIICITVFLTMIPTLLFLARNGLNTEAVGRSPSDFNLYSLTASHLIMPVPGHRIGFMNEIRALFESGLNNNENRYATLGIIGSTGFILSFLLVFWKFKELKSAKVLKFFSILVVLTFATATFGGFGQILYIFFPQIRCYNRISIFIALFSFLIIGFLLQEFSDRLKGKAKYLLPVLVAVMLVVGAVDFSTYHFRMNNQHTIEKMNIMDEFVSEIEETMPPGSMIYQLPYIGNSPIFIYMHNIEHYEHYRPILASNTLRWSYGATYGRPADILHRYLVDQLDTSDMLERLEYEGFTGLYIDLRGYADHGETLLSELKADLNCEPIVSSDGNYVFFDIRGT